MMNVTAAIVEREDCFLATRRGPGKHLAGFWEFPGGKVEEGETEEECLARELHEEFGASVEVGAKFGENAHDYGPKRICLKAYRVKLLSSELKPRDHDEIKWLPADQLETLEWAPADIPLVRKLIAEVGRRRTRSFYDSNAEGYSEATRSIDLTEERTRFLRHVPQSGSILDLGCGSGRDSRAFIELGYKVTALDNSPELASLASRYIGHDIKVGSFRNLDLTAAFDGIWASASLLHCPRHELPSVLDRVFDALKPSGVIYMSFKQGHGEKLHEDGRFFSYHDEESIRGFLEPHCQASEIEIWSSPSKRLKDETWLNCLVKRTSS